MDNRKRQRLLGGDGMVPTNLQIAEESTINVNNLNSFILRNNQVIDTSGLDLTAGNLFFAVCDDNSSESTAEFLSINHANALAHIKQEDESNEILLDEACNSQLQFQVANTSYQRQVQNVVSIPKMENTQALSMRNAIEKLTTAGSTNTTTTVQLPSGCEIYLIKEVIEHSNNNNNNNNNSNNHNIRSDHLLSSSAITTTTTTSNNSVRTGLIPKTLSQPKITCAQSQTATTTTTTKVGQQQQHLVKRLPAETELTNVQNLQKIIRVNNCNNPNTVNTNLPNLLHHDTHHQHQKLTVSAAGSAANIKYDNSSKKTCAFEAYKKRDDKRRATHNEVERRRRDKINSWIFKLKEMLPNTANNTTDVAGSNNSTSPQMEQQQQQQLPRSVTNNSRTPPSDSKSQILIKACEYIKAMQDEIKSLRECLMENEKLRSSNQRLQNELNELRNEYQHNNNNNNNNNINNNQHINNNNNNNQNSNNYNFFIKDDDDIITNLNIVNANNNIVDDDVDDINDVDIDNNRDHADDDDDDDEEILNSSNNNDHHHHHHRLFNNLTETSLINDTIIAPKSAIDATTATSTVNILGKTSLVSLPLSAYTKRELIIRDFVD